MAGFVVQIVFASVFALLAVYAWALAIAASHVKFDRSFRLGLRNKYTLSSQAAWLEGHKAAAPFCYLAGGLALLNSLAVSLLLDSKAIFVNVIVGIGGLAILVGILFYANKVAAVAAKNCLERTS